MEKIWIIIIAISIFIITTIIYFKVTRRLIKKKSGHNTKWGARMVYWQDTIYICTGITFLALVILKWTNVF